jgi:hypothetical protein
VLFLPDKGKKFIIYTALWIIGLIIFEYLSLIQNIVIFTGWKPIPWSLAVYAFTYLWINIYLGPFAELIRAATGYWERAGALWAATVYVIHRQTTAASDRKILSYEWLCGDPLNRFKQIYHELDLTWSPRAERFIRASNAEGDHHTYTLKRPAARQIDKWKERLSAEEIEACRRFVEPFGLPYYPGFEPYVT